MVKKPEKLIHDLTERVKELNCLYEISKLTLKSDAAINHVLKELVELLPPAWHYPDITCGRIIYNNFIIRTDNFIATKWLQAADIIINELEVGSVEVYYLKQMPDIDEGPFLKEERKLLNTIAREISHFLNRKQIEEDLWISRERYRSVVDTAQDIIITLNEQDRITFINNSVKQILGYDISEILGKNIMDLIPDFLPFLRNNVLKRKKTGDKLIAWKQLEFIGFHKNDKAVPLELSVSEFNKDGKHQLTIIMRDITERKIIEEKLSHYNDYLKKEVDKRTTELKIANAKLQKLVDQEREFTKMKDEFTFNINHELRTPLTSITLTVESLMRNFNTQSAKKTNERLQRLYLSVNNLSFIVNQILDFSRIEAGKNFCHLTSFNMKDTLQKLLYTYHDICTQKDLDLHIDQTTNIILNHDKEHLYKILDTLLNNACKFTYKGKIELKAFINQADVVISVADTGCGINKDDYEKIFFSFTQGKFNKNANSGIGIGLHISKKLVKLHGGQIYVKSEVDKGSVFTIILPIHSQWTGEVK